MVNAFSSFCILIRYWRGMYNRFESGIHPRDGVLDIISAAKDHSVSLEDHVLLLEKVLFDIFFSILSA